MHPPGPANDSASSTPAPAGVRPFQLSIEAVAPGCRARLGRFTTPHGAFDTPAFMPVGTRGSVRGVVPAQLRDAGAQIVLANTYHLAVRPGAEIVAELGGLHAMLSWDGPILTDSGGYQVFSLAAISKIDDAGVTFKSHVDGAVMRLDPAGAIAIQNRLGADIIMAFDQCARLPATREELNVALNRTLRWAEQCRDAHRRADQALFGIVQGGLDLELREQCLAGLRPLDFPGYAIGGLSVGESPDEMYALLRRFADRLPADRPRYLMGVGRPIDIVRAVSCGIDLFDCVLPTRNGRNASAFVDGGQLKLRNERHKLSREPLEIGCDCYACRHFSRGTLRHLFLADEMLGPILVSIHNIAYYQRLMRRIRAAIAAGTLTALLAEFESRSAASEAGTDP